MAINCGIVGLPNVGKSTIFSALSSAKAEVANYPFCTIDENIGIAQVNDPRLKTISQLIPSKKNTPTTVEFVDIAGLVKGASKGEGLGNKFLANIRNTSIICHIVRCFEDPDVIHVNGKVSPIDDIETINTELILADLDTVQKRLEKAIKMNKGQKNESKEIALLTKFEKILGSGKSARTIAELNEDDKEIAKELFLLSYKPVIYVCNVDEESTKSGNKYSQQVAEYAKKENCECILISGKVESEIAMLESDEEKKEFREALGLEYSALDNMIKKAYSTLGLKTFFTVGKDENRAWAFKDGMKAPQCAGLIHTDFEKGFIKAEVYSFNDLEKFKNEAEVKKQGLLRLEGKEYEMRDGDIVFFKFNV